MKLLFEPNAIHFKQSEVEEIIPALVDRLAFIKRQPSDISVNPILRAEQIRAIKVLTEAIDMFKSYGY